MKLTESKPTSFPSFKKNAVKAFNLQVKRGDDGEEKFSSPDLYFVWTLKRDNSVKADPINYTQSANDKIIEKIARDKFLQRLKADGYTGLKKSDLEIIRYKENDPRIEGGKLTANIVPTNIERVRAHAATFRDRENVFSVRRALASGATTVDTIINQIKSESDANKFPYYKTFLGHLIKNSGQGFQPITLLDNFDALRAAGFRRRSTSPVSELINDFGEVAGPVGLICASINGNAVRLLPKFLRNSDGSEPTIDDLKREATIHFHASQGHMLVDSYIEYRGNVVRVSSKAAGEALSGGQGASPDGIFKSLDEIAANPEAKAQFEKLIADEPEYETVLTQLRLIARAFSTSELELGMRGYVAQFRLLAELNGEQGEISVTDSDVAILKEIWAAADDSDVGMHEFKFLIGASLGNRPDSDQVSDQGVKYSHRAFSPQFQNILRTFNLNRYGEPGVSGAEKLTGSDDRNQKRGWWRRLKKGLVFNISKIVNKNTRFSTLCTWILNHGAFCQIDMRSRIQRDGGSESLVINNIVATWPSTAVDSVKLMPLPSGDGFRYKLDINGGRGYDSDVESKRLAAEPNDLDYGFGFKNKREREDIRRATIPTIRDLARHGRDWAEVGVTTAPGVGGARGVELQQPNFRGADRQRDTRSNLALQEFFRSLKLVGAIEREPSRDSVEDKADVALELGIKIIDGYSPDVLQRNVRYTVNALWGMRTLEENDDDDDDGDVDTVKLSGSEALSARARAQRDATVAKSIVNMLYVALRVNRMLDSGVGNTKEYRVLRSELETAVKAISVSSWAKYKAVLDNRERGVAPRYSNTDRVAAVTKRPGRPARQPAVAALKTTAAVPRAANNTVATANLDGSRLWAAKITDARSRQTALWRAFNSLTPESKQDVLPELITATAQNPDDADLIALINLYR